MSDTMEKKRLWRVSRLIGVCICAPDISQRLKCSLFVLFVWERSTPGWLSRKLAACIARVLFTSLDPTWLYIPVKLLCLVVPCPLKRHDGWYKNDLNGQNRRSCCLLLTSQTQSECPLLLPVLALSSFIVKSIVKFKQPYALRLYFTCLSSCILCGTCLWI